MATALSLVHSRSWTASRIDDLLIEAGHTVRTIYPADGDPVPTRLDGIDAVTIGGHHISPYLADTNPHVAAELALIEQPLAATGSRAAVPRYLLRCTGTGHRRRRVDRATPRRRRGVRVLPARTHPSGSDMFHGLTHVFQSHYEACLDVPPGGELLARSEMFDVQAFRIGTSAIGLQFHPDTRADMIAGWWEGNAHLHHRLGTHPLERQLVDAEAFEASIHGWTRRFLHDWLGAAQQPPASAPVP